MAQPDFRELMVAQLEASAPKETRGTWQLGLKLPPDMARAMREAARGRDLALAAYARRAIMAMVAHDLGIPYSELMVGEGPVACFANDVQMERGLDGSGHGAWNIGSVSE